MILKSYALRRRSRILTSRELEAQRQLPPFTEKAQPAFMSSKVMNFAGGLLPKVRCEGLGAYNRGNSPILR